MVKINQDRQNIVLSRRELIEQERNEKRVKLLAEMVPGDIRKGTVKNITDFGAFIDLNGIDGLLHITDMSWGRIGHPSEVLKVGQELDVVVLDVNKEKERVSLGLKQKMANPWDNIETKFPVGQKVKGKVVSLVPYGAFVQLEPGVEGLVHVTELSWTKRIAKPSDVLKQDEEIEAVVLGINREEQKISLGIRQLESNPWDTAETKISRWHARSRARSATSPVTARLSNWKRALTAWSTCPTCRGRAKSIIPPRCSRRATRSRPPCSKWTARISASRSA